MDTEQKRKLVLGIVFLICTVGTLFMLSYVLRVFMSFFWAGIFWTFLHIWMIPIYILASFLGTITFTIHFCLIHYIMSLLLFLPALGMIYGVIQMHFTNHRNVRIEVRDDGDDVEDENKVSRIKKVLGHVKDRWDRAGFKFNSKAKDNKMYRKYIRKRELARISEKSSYISDFQESLVEVEYRKEYTGVVGQELYAYFYPIDQRNDPFSVDTIDLGEIFVNITGAPINESILNERKRTTSAADVIPTLEKEERENRIRISFFVRKAGRYEMFLRVRNDILSSCPIVLNFSSNLEPTSVVMEMRSLRNRKVPIFPLSASISFQVSPVDVYGNPTFYGIRIKEHIEYSLDGPAQPKVEFRRIEASRFPKYEVIFEFTRVGVYFLSLNALGKAYIRNERIVMLGISEYEEYGKTVMRTSGSFELENVSIYDEDLILKKRKKSAEVKYKKVILKIDKRNFSLKKRGFLGFKSTLVQDTVKRALFHIEENLDDEAILIIRLRNGRFVISIPSQRKYLVYSFFLHFSSIIFNEEELVTLIKQYLRLEQIGKDEENQENKTTWQNFSMIKQFQSAHNINRLKETYVKKIRLQNYNALEEEFHLLSNKDISIPTRSADLLVLVDRMLERYKQQKKDLSFFFFDDVEYKNVLFEETRNFLEMKVGKDEAKDVSYIFLMLINGYMKEHSLQENEDKVDKIILYLTNYRDKDIMRETFKFYFTSRIIFSSQFSGSSNSGSGYSTAYEERSLLTKLKMNFGFHFTNKMQKMLKDQQINENLNREYESLQMKKFEKRKEDLIKFRPQILTNGIWGLHVNNDRKFNLSKRLQDAVNDYENYYNAKYEGSSRKLTWLYFESYSHCEVSAKYVSGTYILHCSTLEAQVLLLFNPIVTKEEKKVEIKDVLKDNTKKEEKKGVILTQEQIHESLKMMNTRMADFVLLKLSQIKLLKRKKEEVGNAKIFKFEINESFKNRRRKIKLNKMKRKEKKERKKQSIEMCLENRKYAIDAAITRVMKSKQSLTHQTLVVEVIKQLAKYFSVQPRVIKTRINSLIEREILRRDEKNRNRYWYLA